MNRREYQEVVFNSALSPLQKLLYAYLRSCMDYESCIVGDADKKMISYQSIREHLEYDPPRGSKDLRITLSRDQVKRLLARLVKGHYIERLPGKRYGRELRFFLPFASTGRIRPQEERHRSATCERHSSFEGRNPVNTGSNGVNRYGAPTHERHTKNDHERHTSVSTTLSLNTTYSYYDPDDADWHWIGYFLGPEGKNQISVDVKNETEKFNLRKIKEPEYDQTYQREDWRTWMIHAIDYVRAKR